MSYTQHISGTGSISYRGFLIEADFCPFRFQVDTDYENGATSVICGLV